MALLCWLGFHRFPEGWAKFGDIVVCQKCGGRFWMVRDGASDEPRFDRVKR